MTKYIQRVETDQDGYTSWVDVGTEHKISCCDCGLVHILKFNKSVKMKAKRDNRATAQRRRRK